MMKNITQAHVITIMFAIVLVLVGIFVFVSQTSGQISGYNYYMRIELENTGDTTISGAYRIPINGLGMVTGHYIQDDAEDVMINTHSGTEPITAKDLETNESEWRLNHTTIGPNTTVAKVLHFGKSSATRDQVWISHGSDTVVCSDNASLDIEMYLMLKAHVAALSFPASPCARQMILAKPNAYGLYLAGTPNNSWQFEICNAATCTQINLPATLNVSGTITAWYNGGSMIMNHTFDGQIGASKSGSIVASYDDLYACQYNGYCDNPQVRTELP